jgi:hypothetical protein
MRPSPRARPNLYDKSKLRAYIYIYMAALLPSTIKSIDQLLGEWQVYCWTNSIMHNQSRGRYKAMNHGLMIPALLLSSATGLGTIGIGSNSNTAEGTDWPLVALGLIGLASTCLMSVHRLMNVAELQREHDLYSDMFASLANEIDMQLILDDDDSGHSKMFINKREFVKYCKSRMDVLMDKAPPIPKGIARKHVDPVIARMAGPRADAVIHEGDAPHGAS